MNHDGHMHGMAMAPPPSSAAMNNGGFGGGALPTNTVTRSLLQQLVAGPSLPSNFNPDVPAPGLYPVSSKRTLPQGRGTPGDLNHNRCHQQWWNRWCELRE
ncbi:hypothetical protein RND71_030885 [Anisodus tanguticus]|uniref:Uncharacterized protein n=1 Tax=Anisodus tanguticus TaxID=243964 RepID=A0AAE1RJ11_9SOLA|nr:hypothetical protein RND71_030885 [Anisodus tanguticus]